MTSSTFYKTSEYVVTTVRHSWRRMLITGVLFALLFQVLMLLALIVRFQALPNYLHFHDWFSNVVRIFTSTPSVADAVSIAQEEWLIEIGQMNFDYGMGLSIWSLNVIPSRLLVLTVLGALVSLCFVISKDHMCRYDGKRIASKGASAGLVTGSVLVAMTNATMSWVVCCATPSWVVGLAMLGLSVSASLAIESMGKIFSIGGFALLFLTIIFLAWRNVRAANRLASKEMPNMNAVSSHA